MIIGECKWIGKTLLIFAKRIFSSSSETKAVVSLLQLKMLLEEQSASKDDLDLLEKMIQSAPEMKDVAKKTVLTEIAERRSNERKARAEAARYVGRC